MNRSKSFNSIFVFVIVLLIAVVILEYGRGFVDSRTNSYSRSQLERDDPEMGWFRSYYTDLEDLAEDRTISCLTDSEADWMGGKRQREESGMTQVTI